MHKNQIYSNSRPNYSSNQQELYFQKKQNRTKFYFTYADFNVEEILQGSNIKIFNKNEQQIIKGFVTLILQRNVKKLDELIQTHINPIGLTQTKAAVFAWRDNEDNTILHLAAKCKQIKGFIGGTKNLNFYSFGYEMFITCNKQGFNPVHFFADESDKIESCYSYERFISSNLDLSLFNGNLKTTYDVIGISTLLDILQHNNNLYSILNNGSDKNFKPGIYSYKYIFESLCKYFLEKTEKYALSRKDFMAIGEESQKDKVEQDVVEENKQKYLLLESNWNETIQGNNANDETQTQDKEDLLDKYFAERSEKLDKSEIIILQFPKQDDDTSSWGIVELSIDLIENDLMCTEKTTLNQQIIDVPNIGVKNCHKIKMSPSQQTRYLKYLVKKLNLNKVEPQDLKKESLAESYVIESSKESYVIESLEESLDSIGNTGGFGEKTS